MTQLTIRSHSLEIEAKLKALAAERGWSLNQAANYLLLKGANPLDEAPSPGIGSQLDEFTGSWSEEEALAFDERVAELSRKG